jgi:hypothetical protein
VLHREGSVVARAAWARRSSIKRHTARFSSSSMRDQAAISSMVRWQPSHRPVAALMRQMLMQGLGTGVGKGIAGLSV